MFDKLTSMTTLDTTQVDALRQEALEHYERCLQESSPNQFQNFIEYHLVHHSAQLDLFLSLADDLQQRMLALRGYHFDVRNRVVQLLLSMYQTDISHLAPADGWEDYHLIDPNLLITSIRQKGTALSSQEEIILIDMIKTSMSVCAQLHRDILLTEQLLILLDDWLEAYKVLAVRQMSDWGQSAPKDGLALVH